MRLSSKVATFVGCRPRLSPCVPRLLLLRRALVQWTALLCSCCALGFGVVAPTIRFDSFLRPNKSLCVELRVTPVAIVMSVNDDDDAADANVDAIAVDQRVILDTDNAASSSPRSWLESQPMNGVYTVIRCDFYNKAEAAMASRPRGQWKVWGLDFHVQRLRDSWKLWNGDCCSVAAAAVAPPERSTDHAPIERLLGAASNQTERLLWRLLEEAEAILFPTLSLPLGSTPSSCSDQVAMVTILWQPCTATTTTARIAVSSHICASRAVLDGQQLSLNQDTGGRQRCWPFESYHPKAVTAMVATIKHHHERVQLPNRGPLFAAKCSAWCRERRPLEHAYMHVWRDNGSETVHEVILMDPDNHSILLEGLTSNLFVVYPHRVIRTAGTKVLPGYARHLVQQVLQDETMKDWTLDTTTPIRLEDADSWEQVFVTSAIRLVVPVQAILVPVDGTPRRYVHLWRADERQSGPPVWKEIYQLMLARTYGK
jgi:branched-subunit amino acid aminotransferase/4-amino-4-deoxychorismate lyase